jgi:hypothetical protein
VNDADYGLIFDFTTKPVISPPQPRRETVQVRAVRHKCDALQFARLRGVMLRVRDLARKYTAPDGRHDARDEMPPTIDALLRDLRDPTRKAGLPTARPQPANDSCRADGRREKVASRVALFACTA